MRVSEATIRVAVEEASRRGMTAFETAIVAQLADVDLAAAEDGLYKLYRDHPDELALELHYTCPRDDCNRQLSRQGVTDAGVEIDCPFCSTRFHVGPAAGHSMWMPKGALAAPGPRLVAISSHLRSRLSPLAERSVVPA